MKTYNRELGKICFFCGSKDNIIITNVGLRKHNGIIRNLPVCNICFNRAKSCEDGLDYEGNTVYVDEN